MIHAAIVCALFAAPEDLTIADVAPADALFVVGMDSPFGMDGLDEDLPAAALFTDPRLVTWFETFQENNVQGEGLTALFEEMGLEKDDMVYPT
ncbi:MAG: hypothetical protein KDA28_01065, partial [Phycisphaerales bacterium]|nr:hypothetical protein [Phycisphaerales bacterium]